MFFKVKSYNVDFTISHPLFVVKQSCAFYSHNVVFVLGGMHALHVSVAVKSLGSDFPRALGSVLPLSFVHLPIVLSDLVLAYPAPGR